MRAQRIKELRRLSQSKLETIAFGYDEYSKRVSERNPGYFNGHKATLIDIIIANEF